jgi:hygromycin-B 7''-O-kinase
MNLPRIVTQKDFDTHFQSEIWLATAREICLRHCISFIDLRRVNSSDHVVFTIDDSLILKIYRPFRNCFGREIKALEFINGKTDFEVPEILHTGELEGFEYVLMTQLKGISIQRSDWLNFSQSQQINFIVKLANGLKHIHELEAESFENNWSEFVKNRSSTFIDRQISHQVNSKIIKALPKFIDENLKLVPLNNRNTFMHADIHFGNLRLSNGVGNPQISGLFDFADSRCGFHEYDFLAIGILIMQGQREIQREFFKAFGYAEKDLKRCEGV